MPMSGWDQKYDLQDWAKAIQDEAHSLQRTNKAARYIYLCGVIACLVIALVGHVAFPLGIAAFFFLLLAFNEHMIWKLKRKGIK